MLSIAQNFLDFLLKYFHLLSGSLGLNSMFSLVLLEWIDEILKLIVRKGTYCETQPFYHLIIILLKPEQVLKSLTLCVLQRLVKRKKLRFQISFLVLFFSHTSTDAFITQRNLQLLFRKVPFGNWDFCKQVVFQKNFFVFLNSRVRIKLIF